VQLTSRLKIPLPSLISLSCVPGEAREFVQAAAAHGMVRNARADPPVWWPVAALPASDGGASSPVPRFLAEKTRRNHGPRVPCPGWPPAQLRGQGHACAAAKRERSGHHHPAACPRASATTWPGHCAPHAPKLVVARERGHPAPTRPVTHPTARSMRLPLRGASANCKLQDRSNCKLHDARHGSCSLSKEGERTTPVVQGFPFGAWHRATLLLRILLLSVVCEIY
jgi:hypothetical protein